MESSQKKVLIVGAGPTGLALAVQLAELDIPFKLVENEEGPGNSSRAMTVLPRILEQYHSLGITEKVISKGIQLEKGNLWVDGEKKAELNIGEFGEGESAFPFLLTYPQDEHERLLVKQLEDMGEVVYWNTECRSLEQDDEGVEVEFFSNGEVKREQFSYVVGCDGASSKVRKALDFSFEGGTYDELFYVMDARLDHERFREKEVHFHFFEEVLALFFPLRNKETTRVIGMFPPQLTEKNETSAESIIPILEEAFSIQLSELKWFSTYTVYHRLAEQFRKNRVFLAGDAAHIHSPVGGQGMNAGIGDALNLGWKLAAVLKGEAKEEILETYEEERKGFAEQLVSSTDRMFKVASSTGEIAKWARKQLMPMIAEPTMNLSLAIRKRYFRMLSQIRVSYEESSLSEGQVGKVKAGMRVPYTSHQKEWLGEKGWQLLVFGQVDQELSRYAEAQHLLLKNYSWSEEAKQAGYKKGAIYLIRPDDHVALVSSESKVEELDAFKEKWRLLF